MNSLIKRLSDQEKVERDKSPSSSDRHKQVELSALGDIDAKDRENSIQKTDWPATPSKPTKVIVKKQGFFATLLKPIFIAIALLITVYGITSLATNYWRSYNRHLDYTADTHQDKTLFQVFQKTHIPADQVALIIRDYDGQVKKVAASRTQLETFLSALGKEITSEKERVKKDTEAELAALFETSFDDRDQVIEEYADWFFEWKRSYVILKEAISSTASRLLKTGEYESLKEAVGRDVKDYFMANYKSHVLKPELRDQKITEGLERIVRRAHGNYLRLMAYGDRQMRDYLTRHTAHLEVLPPDQNMTSLKLDWDSQRWKAPVYLVEDKAFDGIAGIGRLAASGTVGALVLGPVINRSMGAVFGMLSRRFVTSMGARIAFAEKGAVAGTVVEPVGGTAVGAVIGLMLGFAADYFINKADEKFNRDKFIAANREALATTMEQWQGKLQQNVDEAIDRWFDDAKASLILVREEQNLL